MDEFQTELQAYENNVYELVKMCEDLCKIKEQYPNVIHPNYQPQQETKVNINENTKTDYDSDSDLDM